MLNKKKTCGHILANGEVCQAIPMRDSNFCYWHHKARSRNRRHDRLGGPVSMDANSGIDLPLLEDANSIQIAIQEIMQAILDRRIDSKRAGLLLYSLQLASSNVRNLDTCPSDFRDRVVAIGDNDERAMDHIGKDDRAESCDHDCEECDEDDCDQRDECGSDDTEASDEEDDSKQEDVKDGTDQSNDGDHSATAPAASAADNIAPKLPKKPPVSVKAPPDEGKSSRESRRETSG